MVFNFSLTQKLSLFFYCQRDSFVSGIFPFLTESGPYISAGFKKPEEIVRVQSYCSSQQIICLHSARTEKSDRVLFLKHG